MISDYSEAFAKVKKSLFPRWPRTRQWRIKEGYRSSQTFEGGYCDRKNHVIWVAPGNSGTDLELVIAHEICHALTGSGHGKKFQARLLKASIDAQDQGNGKLAKVLKTEAEMYRDMPVMTAKDIYLAVGEILDDIPQASFDAVLKHLSHTLGLTRIELLKKYRRLKSVYDKEVRERIRAGLRKPE